MRSEEGGRKIREIKWEKMKTFYLTQGGKSKNINFRENEWVE